MKYKAFSQLLFAGLLLLTPCLTHALDVGVAYQVYATPEKPYLEINIEIAAASVTFKRVDSLHLQAGVETLILVKRDNEVVNYEKYRLNSPMVAIPQNLLDVKRMFVPAGRYELEISFQDIYDPENNHTFTAPLTVDLGSGAYLSDILLLRSYKPDNSDSPFTKNGYFMEPLPFKYYDRTATMLAFYAEIYHTGKVVQGDSYQVRYVLEEDLSGGNTALISVGTQQKRPSAIDAVLIPVNISKLKSGNYQLTVELRNSLNELLARRNIAFQRSNPFLDVPEAELTADVVEQQFVNELDEENLRYSLRAISPLMYGDDSEVLKNILQGSDLKSMRYFLFRHFVNLNPNNPEQVYLEFMKVAGAADKQFRSGFRYGFESDRGRTYIRYGRPDDLVHIEDDPSAPPYEIWIYYNFPKTNQKNVKFLFYNPTLAGEDYIMLHSTARGEINNPRWERDLYKRNAGEEFSGDNYHDSTTMQRNIGRNARTFFEDF
ncbi:MAG: GWxTD domain-containing protein [Bacteroidetes bacterium]|nr:MAG: GWxTD domain-containing protein [Bacteroidota bacterium]